MVLGDRSPVRWTTATMSYSGIWKGVCGMTWIASRQSSGMCSASAISWVGKIRWSLRTWQHTSTPSSWKRWSIVVKRAGWLLEAACACLPGEYVGLVVMASDELASSTCFDSDKRSWSWTTIWNPSPWPTWCVGRNVLGIWIHLYVMRHSACLQCLPASAAWTNSYPLTTSGNEQATEYIWKVSALPGKTVTMEATRGMSRDCVTIMSYTTNACRASLGGSGSTMITSNQSSLLSWSTHKDWICASHPLGGPTNWRMRGAVHLWMVRWSMYHVRTARSKSLSCGLSPSPSNLLVR